jgi:hypothetical protein
VQTRLWREKNPVKAIAQNKKTADNNRVKNKEATAIVTEGVHKTCSVCFMCYPITEYDKDATHSDGRKSECKRCEAISSKIYRDSHAEEIRLSKKKYLVMNSVRINARANNKYHTDIKYRIKCSLRSRIGKAIKNSQKVGSAVDDLGCSVDFLKIYLEERFQPGMSWDNWSKTGWHIDHVVPLDKFDLTDREQFLIACHYTNLQPLWSTENLHKSNKTDWVSKNV